MLKLKKLLAAFAAAAVMAAGIPAVSAADHAAADALNHEKTQSSYQAASSNEEMRAVWVPFLSLDRSKERDQSAAAFQKMYDNIIAVAKKNNINTLIVHVRPFGDSMYPSYYFPWSHLLTGTQGKDPGFDPLAYMVKATHNAGMKFHAWVNPLRIKKGDSYPPAISQNNAHTVWKANSDRSDWTFTYNDGIYFNPGYEEVRQHIADGVWEIAKNYDVDGIQFDDYFYPFNVNSTEVMPDRTSFTKSGTPLAVGKWRTENINRLIALVYQRVKGIKPNVEFGISPQGNIQNCLNMGADIYTWTSKPGYVDYICPQIYVPMNLKALPFEETAKKWQNMITAPNVKYYLGLGLYKSGKNDQPGYEQNTVMARQVQVSRNIKSDGFMLYSWAFLDNAQTREEMANLQKLMQ